MFALPTEEIRRSDSGGGAEPMDARPPGRPATMAAKPEEPRARQGTGELSLEEERSC